MQNKHALLIILDGWGISNETNGNAIKAANTKYIDHLLENYPTSTLKASGSAVGLPNGQMGNSEVGHLTIGSGRVINQDLVRINKAIEDGTFTENEELQKAIKYAKKENKSIHLLGLVSKGGVHSHLNHLKALCDTLEDKQTPNVYIHAFLDGRDSDPKSGAECIKDICYFIENKPIYLATIVGRYYAMDRDKHWDRVKKAYDLLVKEEGINTKDPQKTIEKMYEEGTTDEFMQPLVCDINDKNCDPRIKEGDVVIFFNFRTDRPRQLTYALSQGDIKDSSMEHKNLYYVTMTEYDDRFKNIHVMFPRNEVKKTLSEIVSQKGLTQLKIAETEKYAHVTYFLNGHKEEAYKGENRILIASPNVDTYDKKPEMSSYEITESCLRRIQHDHPNLIIINYANADMVGHTGNFLATKTAIEAVDSNVKRLVKIAQEQNYDIIVTADHGNAEKLIDGDNPHTAHTNNDVFAIVISDKVKEVKKNGGLEDIAPSILKLLNIKKPKEMTGKSLF